ncbi:MAG: DUF3800 domain-containing protein [Desulfobaccales bacterium]
MEQVKKITQLAFGDESHWGQGKYRAIGLVSLSRENYDPLKENLNNLLAESGVKEFKWNNLRGARERFAAEKLIDFSLESALKKLLRFDILIWDIEDSRHNIKGRDDLANLQRMYYKLFYNVMKKRWPDGCVWRLHPDEHSAMDWSNIQNFLSYKEVEIEFGKNLFSDGGFKIFIRNVFNIENIIPVRSEDEPFIQLADLFTGMAVYSRNKYDGFCKWEKNKSGQKSLFDENHHQELSRAEIERYKILYYFNMLCKKHKLHVSLREKKGLFCFNQNFPFNFWLYQPQHPEDKAPVKGNKEPLRR